MSKADGKHIAIRFTENITGGITGSEDAFSVTGQEYNRTPGGELIAGDYQIESVTPYNGIDTELDIADGTLEDTKIVVGALKLDGVGRDYVSSGMALLLDGIDNTESGHDNSAPIWYDLSGSNDFTEGASVTRKANAINITSTSASNTAYRIQSNSPLVLGTEWTIEQCLRLNAEGASTNDVFISLVQAGVIKFCNFFNQGFIKLGSYAGDFYSSGPISYLGQMATVSMTYLNGTITCYINGMQVYTGSVTITAGNYTVVIGQYRYSHNTELPNSNIDFYSFRYYNRALIAAEIEDNYVIDQARFNPVDGYITLDGSNDYAELPAAVGSLSGAFSLDIAFRPTNINHKGIISKLNPSGGGAGSSKGWLLGFNNRGKTKFYYSPTDGDITEHIGSTTIAINIDYILRLQSDGITVWVKLSTDGGATWTTESAINDADALSCLAENNAYPTQLGRGRWAGAWGDYYAGRIGILRIVKGSSDPDAALAHEYRMAVTGTNPAIPDRIGAQNGASYNGVTGTIVTFTGYKDYGEAGYTIYVGGISSYAASKITWEATTPTRTSVTISAAVGEVEPAPEDYTVCTNENNIPGLSGNLTGKTLYIKVALSTTDTAVTPSLTALLVSISDTSDARTILMTMKDLNRFHNVAGDLTVSYDGSGGLIGVGGAVAAFSVSFTPQDLTAKPHQNEQEHIEITNISANGTLKRIYYTDTAEQDQGHIEIVGISAVGTLTHINDI